MNGEAEDVWLVKVPEFVAERWRTASQTAGGSVEFACVRAVPNAQQNTEELHLLLNDEHAQGLPRTT
ncbi:hypothetical protein WJX84_011029 [Apatococcus fuscideae]|uniref:TFIIF beta subunit N-terminal domain-containing protein n=1 Tax=Apatococcus fuscideae TaxID=2026836 RepID=A0AAW1T3B7_9CHLO